MRKTVPKNFKGCMTCVHWCGTRQTNPSCSVIHFEDSIKGKCAGGGFNNLQMSPLSSCNKYKSWL